MAAAPFVLDQITSEERKKIVLHYTVVLAVLLPQPSLSTFVTLAVSLSLCSFLSISLIISILVLTVFPKIERDTFTTNIRYNIVRILTLCPAKLLSADGPYESITPG